MTENYQREVAGGIVGKCQDVYWKPQESGSDTMLNILLNIL
jgi:hypothetical protein